MSQVIKEYENTVENKETILESERTHEDNEIVAINEEDNSLLKKDIMS